MTPQAQIDDQDLRELQAIEAILDDRSLAVQEAVEYGESFTSSDQDAYIKRILALIQRKQIEAKIEGAECVKRRVPIRFSDGSKHPHYYQGQYDAIDQMHENAEDEINQLKSLLPSSDNQEGEK